MSAINLHQPISEGKAMAPYRDRLAQHRQCSAEFIETADSTIRAREFQRRERAEHLERLLVASTEVFDLMFVRFYAEDDSIVLFLSKPAAARGLTLVTTGRQQ